MGIKRTTIKLLGDRPQSRYTAVPNALLLDTELSSDARLLGIYLRSLQDGWEINQEQIAAALGWPTKRRVVNAMQSLITRGWLRHNERKGPRGGVYQHQYVMHRDRRFNGAQSAPMDDSANGAESALMERFIGDESAPVTGAESALLPKEQKNSDEDQTTPAPAWGGAEEPQPEPDPWRDPVPAAATPTDSGDPTDPWSVAFVPQT